MKKLVFLILCSWSFSQLAFGQNDSISTVDIDEIEVILKDVRLSAKGDSVTVEFVLHSYLKEPRELKINTFSTGVISPEGKTMFYDMMSIGKVRIALANRQNYFHYLLARDEPVLFTIKTPAWQKRWGQPKIFRITLEDHDEEGKFLQVDIPL